MVDDFEQFEPQPRWRRMIRNPWGRVGIAVVLIALVGVAAYFVFGLVSGGAARLSLSPNTGNYYQGSQIRVSVMLNSTSSANRQVAVVAAYVRYDPNFLFIENLAQDVRVGSAWNASTVHLVRVNDDVDLDGGRGLEIIVGQSTPGILINSSSLRQVAVITFRVRNTFPGNVDSATTLVRFDTFLPLTDSRSMVIADDAEGTDILGYSPSSPGSATYSLFRMPADTSCATVHPGAFVCGTNEFCPTPSQYTDIGPTCCSVACISGQQLTIDESSIYPEIIRSGTTVTQVIIHWRTNLPSTSNVINFQGVQNYPQTEDTNPVSDHAFVLQGVDWPSQDSGTTYRYQVRSEWRDPNPFCDPATNLFCRSEATSQEYTFTLQTEQVRRLQIFDLSARGVSNTSAVISWTTNLPADSFAICSFVGNAASPEDCPREFLQYSPTPVTLHTFTIRDLSPGTTYSFDVKSEISGLTAFANVSFTTKNVAVENDANVILKVERDRVCDNWLTCTSSLKVTNKQKKIEDMCFALGECDTLDPTTGQCLSVKSDAPISRFVTRSGDRANSTVDQAKNLSGYSKAELEITGFSPDTDNTTLKGFSSFASLRQYGSSVAVVNGTFDTGVGVYPWTSHPSNSASFDAVFDEAAGGNVMQVASSSGMLTWGAKISLGKDSVAKKVPYFVSFDARAALPANASMSEIKVQFGYQGYRVTNASNSTYKISIGSGWEKLVVGPFIPPADIGELGEVFLGLLVTSDIPRSNHPLAFYVDNVLIQPVLQAGSGLYIPRVCRAYPTASAPTCDYFDPFSGKAFRGWKGYCLVPDPKDSTGADCLQWWPVDVISGTASSFGSDPQAGYLAQGGRFPLYYCLEAEGNYPYVNKYENSPQRRSTSFANIVFRQYCLGPVVAGVSALKVCTVDNPIEIQIFPGDFKPFLGIPKSSIAYIEVPWNNGDPEHTFVLSEANDWSAWRLNGPDCPSVSSWSEFEQYAGNTQSEKDACQGIVNDNCDMNGIRFVFDDSTEKLKTIRYGVCDDSPDTGHTSIQSIIFYRREACSVITQVVDPFGKNAAQTSRISSKTYKVPGVQYGYVSDYRPFGAVVHPDPDFDPTALRSDGLPFWNKLFFEPPSAETFSEEPFQVRAGQPYGIKTKAKSLGYCKSNTNIECDPSAPDPNAPCRATDTCVMSSQTCLLSGYPCGSAADCNQQTCEALETCDPLDYTSCETSATDGYCSLSGFGCSLQATNPDGTNADCSLADADKVCLAVQLSGLGKKTCITGPNRGKSCNNHFDCGQFDDGTLGLCTGIDKPKEIPEYGTFTAFLAGNPGTKLSNLFTKTYGTWQWIGGSYKQICKEGGQPVCTDGPNKGLACVFGTTADSPCPLGSCGYVETQSSSDPGTGLCGPSASKIYGWDAREGSRAQALGVQPKAPSVSNVKVNEKEASDLYRCVGGTNAGEQCTLPSDCPYGSCPVSAGNYPVELSFTSLVDVNQLPLVRYTVDWGDGEITSEGELSLAPKSDPKNPHRLGHVYRYFEPATPYPFGCRPDVNCDGRYDSVRPGYPNGICNTSECRYNIRIQIQDNWGWCNGTGDTYQCGLNTGNAWTVFGRDIVVTP